MAYDRMKKKNYSNNDSRSAQVTSNEGGSYQTQRDKDLIAQRNPADNWNMNNIRHGKADNVFLQPGGPTNRPFGFVGLDINAMGMTWPLGGEASFPSSPTSPVYPLPPVPLGYPSADATLLNARNEGTGRSREASALIFNLSYASDSVRNAGTIEKQQSVVKVAGKPDDLDDDLLVYDNQLIQTKERIINDVISAIQRSASPNINFNRLVYVVDGTTASNTVYAGNQNKGGIQMSVQSLYFQSYRTSALNGGMFFTV